MFCSLFIYFYIFLWFLIFLDLCLFIFCSCFLWSFFEGSNLLNCLFSHLVQGWSLRLMLSQAELYWVLHSWNIWKLLLQASLFLDSLFLDSLLIGVKAGWAAYVGNWKQVSSDSMIKISWHHHRCQGLPGAKISA